MEPFSKDMLSRIQNTVLLPKLEVKLQYFNESKTLDTRDHKHHWSYFVHVVKLNYAVKSEYL